MKILVLALLGLSAFAFGYPFEKQTTFLHRYKLTDGEFVKKYQEALRLFKYMNQPTYYKDHVDTAKSYNCEENVDRYYKPEVVKHFMNYYNHDILPREAIFSIFYKPHTDQAVALYNLFYYAKDWETFYKTAVWARYYVNPGLFLYSYSVALIHRPDTYGMVLPPIYEIYPHYFFNSEVMQKASTWKQTFAGAGQPKEYMIQANYSGWYMNVHPEQSLSYFTEDVGLNAFYYYYNLYRPFWMDFTECKIHSYNRGEEYYFFYQQLVARYYLERLSNEFGEIPNYEYEGYFPVGYTSSLEYPNGMSFPSRPTGATFLKHYYNYVESAKSVMSSSWTWVRDYERRIRDAIDSGFVLTSKGEKINIYEPEGFNILGNIIEGNPSSPNARFYGYLQMFARHLLGYSLQPLDKYHLAPSALQHFETSMRDPAFWMFYKRMVNYMQKYKFYEKPYTHEDLAFPGVEIKGMEVDRLITYFDQFYSDLTYATHASPQEWDKDTFAVYAQQYRLNHKPFTYKIQVQSDKATNAVVRVFIGPKYDEYERVIHLRENRLNFVQLDTFQYDLKEGPNAIERNSQQLFMGGDHAAYRQMMEYCNSNKFEVDASNVYFSLPNRLMLPKGSRGGTTYQMYVIVSPYKPGKSQSPHPLYKGTEYDFFKYPIVGLGVQYMDGYALGYPFDRRVDETCFYVPNSIFHEVVIYHKEIEEMQQTKAFKKGHYN